MLESIKKYPITYTLITLNIVVYFFSAILSHSPIDMNTKVLLNMGALYGPLSVEEGEWWRLFTAMFLHGGIMHIFMNMYSLYLVGRSVETYFTPKSYVAIYLFSGLIGGLISLYVHPQSVGVGASGAIFGIFGALAGFFLVHKDEIAKQSKAFMSNFGSVIALNLVIGLSIPNIDMSAHIGGLVAGFIGGYLLAKDPKNIWLYSGIMIVSIFAMMNYLTK